MYDIKFPGLGITLHNIKDGINIFGLDVKLYGLVIALGFILAYFMIKNEAVRTKQDSELYLDFILWMFIPAILGARIYYVLFAWRKYFIKGRGIQATLFDIINIRGGGLAIYGGIIAGVITAIIFCKKKKYKFSLLADTACFGLLIGQIIGRWGNFFNREAFGMYTDSKFAMCIPLKYFEQTGILKGQINAGVITDQMLGNTLIEDGLEWISVQPTFLYESLWNLMILVVLLVYRRHKKFDGELFLIYLWGYGMGRVWIESLRSDSLMSFGGGIKISQLLAALCVMVASVIIVKKRLDVAGATVEKHKKSTANNR